MAKNERNLPVLYCYSDVHKNVVFRFGFAVYVELLDTKGKCTSNRLEWPLDAMETRVDESLELTKILHNPNFLGSNACKATKTHFAKRERDVVGEVGKSRVLLRIIGRVSN
jgi:hypothetical protein